MAMRDVMLVLIVVWPFFVVTSDDWYSIRVLGYSIITWLFICAQLLVSYYRQRKYTRLLAERKQLSLSLNKSVMIMLNSTKSEEDYRSVNEKVAEWQNSWDQAWESV